MIEALSCVACEAEWRGENPPAFPCRQPDCCTCSGDRCGDTRCLRCFFWNADAERFEENGERFTWPCANGACPSCGGLYVEWLSFGMDPADVVIHGEPIDAGAYTIKRGGSP